MTVTKAFTVDDGIFDIDVAPPMLSPDDARSKLFLVGNICNSTYTDRGRKNVGQATEVALMNVLPVVGLRDQREVSSSLLAVHCSGITDPVPRYSSSYARPRFHFRPNTSASRSRASFPTNRPTAR